MFVNVHIKQKLKQETLFLAVTGEKRRCQVRAEGEDLSLSDSETRSQSKQRRNY